MERPHDATVVNRAKGSARGRVLRVVTLALVALVALALSVVRDAALGSTTAVIVRVAPNGSDGCTRGNGSVPCQSLGRAYAIAQPGDVVSVAAGKYPAQRLLSGGKGRRGPAITIKCRPVHSCILSDLTLGQNSGSSSGDAPSYVNIDGIDVTARSIPFTTRTPTRSRPTS